MAVTTTEAIHYVSNEDGETTAVLVPIELWREVSSEKKAEPRTRDAGTRARDGWKHFVADTYGCMADAPIERGDQGSYERREDIA